MQPTNSSRPRWKRSRWAVLAVAIACVAGLCVAVVVASYRGGAHKTRRLADMSPSRGRIVGRFYPVLDRTDTTTLVLPSGLRVTLAHDLSRAIGGLGAAFYGLVTPKDAAVCCALSFGIAHAAPGELFDTLGASAISTPVLMSAARAKQVDLKQFKGAYGILSTGEWTLTATFENGESGPLADATVLERLGSWRLRSTPSGAVLSVPAETTIDQPGVVLGRTPDLNDRQIELTQNLQPCVTNSTARMITDAVYSTVGYWCEHGLFVRIEGPRSYVQSAVASLEVKVEQDAKRRR